MRVKDDKKQEALFLATVKVVNEIGFSASSVSKIAKEAGVSPSTLYIYFENKEDLIVSTYIEIKKDMSQTALSGLDESLPIRDILHQIWHKSFLYVIDNKEEFIFTEQFANSPYRLLVNHEELEPYFMPVIRTVERGIEQKIIKNVHFEILLAFMFIPIFVLANPNHSCSLELNRDTIDTSFNLAWDAIKL